MGGVGCGLVMGDESHYEGTKVLMNTNSPLKVSHSPVHDPLLVKILQP